jgi:uncharacterized protein YfaS (alpha-2-macroglobulin family)
MKMRLFIVGVVVAIPLLAHAIPQSRQAQWRKVDEALSKGLPKTAIDRLEPIIKQAIADRAYPEAIKAIAKRIALEGTIQGNKPEERITRLKAEIAKAPAEMIPVMDAILANWHWHFFQQNRGRFLQRTQTSTPPGDDILSWDLPRVFAEIDKQFTKALSADKVLKNTPIATYNDLLEKGTVPDKYRPTLYDFLVHNALAFYSTPEQAGAKSEDFFELPADSPIFRPDEDFLKWEVKTADADSRTVKAIRLYQDLLRFHENDNDKSAYLDADLHRLQFGWNTAFGDDKAVLYKSALRRFSEAHKDHEISARALFNWASVLQTEQELVEARRLAKKGADTFPESVGGRMCHNLIQQIEAKSVSIDTERVWNEPLPSIGVRYRNLTKVYFRAVPFDFEQKLDNRRYRPEQLDPMEQKALLNQRPTLAWAADLPATEDYRERLEKLTAPKNLKSGSYFLISSHNPNFSEEDNQVFFTPIWVSDLALVMRTRHSEGVLEGFVLNAKSGEPIAGVEVRAWYRNQQQVRIQVPAVRTDKNGLFRFEAPQQRNNYLVLAKYKKQTLAAAHDFFVYHNIGRPVAHAHTVFFTDRSLYRPGQTIQYKGLVVGIDQENDQYKAQQGTNLTVVFADRNGKEVAKQQHQTNDYGSFSGSFTAPYDRGTGRMHLRVEGQPHGQAHFNVEEYKRPKFQVTLEKPTAAAKLNALVTVPGKAMAYTGAPVDGGKVRYRVSRQVRFPPWWGYHFWWRPMPPQPSQEIAHGFAFTKVDGSFQIDFVAKPDLSVSEKDEPTFYYQVSADVTDPSGETRSGQLGVNVAYTALRADMTAADWLTNEKPSKVTIKTTTHDGEPQVAEGSVKIYRLKQPAKVHRKELQSYHYYQPRIHRPGKDKEPEPDLSNPNSWPLGEVVLERGFTTDKEGKATIEVALDAGPYRAMLETQDKFSKKVTARLPLTVLDPGAKKFALKVPNHVASPTWKLEPGSDFTVLWGTGYDQGRAFIEIEHRRKPLQAFWTEPGRTQVAVKQAVNEAMRGGFTVRVTMVRENRAYLEQRRVDVPWSNKELTVRWERFVSKLEPGQKETWTAVVTGPEAKKAVAEMVAALYDESLDAFLPHNWMRSLTHIFRQDHSNVHAQFENILQHLSYLHGRWPMQHKGVDWTYRHFPHDIAGNFFGYEWGFQSRGGAFPVYQGYAGGFGGPPGAPMAGAVMKKSEARADGADRLAATEPQLRRNGLAEKEGGVPAQSPGPDLSKVSARKNLNETAFFFPHLISDQEGLVKIQFTMPEALTKWKFLGFAHDQDLRSGYLSDSAVTAKDLMVQPYPPRFLREGDLLEFTVKVTNQSDEKQTGSARLTFADARTGKSVDAALGNTSTDQSFQVPAKESRSYSWKIKVPDDMGFLSYKAVASTDKLSDGEEGYLPVLSKRVLVIESLPLPIRGPATKDFEFARLKKSGDSDTLRHKQVTVQVVSNPNWYAVMALPYLMEYPYECSEQIFNRLYANGLARHIANSDPKIRKVFDLWKGTPALDSPLEKNRDLMAVALEETPWVRQAQNESQARRNVGILFDDNRLNNEMARHTQRMAELQLPDGAWPWFPGGPPNDYITLYITTGYGRLRHLGVQVDLQPAVRSLARLDGWIDGIYQEIVRKGRKKDNNLSPTIALYLYGRSFFLTDQAIAQNHKEAVDYFLVQGEEYWLKLANRQSQAHLAIALNRFGRKDSAQGIMKSIKERAVTNEEFGMFWRDLELSWWWFRAPIETQAMMIEAFDEVMKDRQAVEDCKVWLIKQKQTQDWKTTKATADAVYALLLRGGKNPLASDALVEISLGGQQIQPEKVEAGTGFYEKRFQTAEIKPQMGDITLKKVDEGVAWASVHWQYLEDVGKVSAYEGTPLKLKKALYTRVYTKKGPVLQPVNGALKVGDELVVRVELRSDRDMEYVHLKDARGSGTEPVNVLSRYKYQDGLAYYESTRDTASHFFIDYLPKGTYVFEYSTRVMNRGTYATGMAQIQCMYAPEFNSHSESFTLRVE